MLVSRFLKTLLFLLLLIWLGGYGWFVTQVLVNTHSENVESKDGIIILTGGKNRIQEGLKLFANGKAPKLLITGVHPKSPDKDILSLWDDKAKALPQCCITFGREATTTIENAIESKNWVEKNDIKEVLLVTSAYHMPRAIKEFKNIMPKLLITPYPVTHENNLTSPFFWSVTFSEYNKNLFRDATIYVEKNFLK
ncbi:MAG: YdcF family protein [Alphaproteobacteria bacterium]|nr:YdcF family protein [Alphaproteobacteria bacterium]